LNAFFHERSITTYARRIEQSNTANIEPDREDQERPNWRRALVLVYTGAIICAVCVGALYAVLRFARKEMSSDLPSTVRFRIINSTTQPVTETDIVWPGGSKHRGPIQPSEPVDCDLPLAVQQDYLFKTTFAGKKFSGQLAGWADDDAVPRRADLGVEYEITEEDLGIVVQEK
jgi:hypothetical protein